MNFLKRNKIYNKYFDSAKRQNFRNRRILYSSLSSLLAKFIAIFVSLYSVPLTYNYLSPDRFGVMMTIVSVVSSLSFADFGIGFSLQHRWSELNMKENNLLLKKAISTVFFFYYSSLYYYLF